MVNNLTQKRIFEELAKFNRRIDSIEKGVNALSTDERNILEDINSRLAAVEEAIASMRRHNDVVKKDIKDEIQIANDRTVAKVDTRVEEIQDQIEKKKIIQIKGINFWSWLKFGKR